MNNLVHIPLQQIFYPNPDGTRSIGQNVLANIKMPRTIYDVYTSDFTSQVTGISNGLFTLSKYPTEIIGHGGTVTKELHSKMRLVGQRDVLGFDIDNITVSEAHDFIEHFMLITGIGADGFFTTHTGGGLHFLVPIAESISHERYGQYVSQGLYDKLYKKIFSTIPAAKQRLDPHGLKSWNRTSRIPHTLNLKYVKGLEVSNEVLPLYICEEAQVPTWEDILGPLKNTHIRTLAPQNVKMDLSEQERLLTDMKGCVFLKESIENRATLKEPEWFAALRICSQAPTEELATHAAMAVSKDHSDFSEERTLKKLESAKQYSTLCTAVGRVSDACDRCSFKGKIHRPVEVLLERRFLLHRGVNFRVIKKDGSPAEKVDHDALEDYLGTLLQSLCAVEQSGALMTLFLYDSEGLYKEFTRKSFETYVFDKVGSLGVASERHLKALFPNLVQHVRKTSPHKVNRDPLLLHLKDGIYNTQTKEVIEHSFVNSSDRIFPFSCKQTLAFQRKPDPKRFKRFLWSSLYHPQNGPHIARARIKALQCFFGSALLNSPPTNDGKALFCYGGGSNGKSALINIMSKLLGEDRVESFSSSKLDPQTVFKIKNSVLAIDADARGGKVNGVEILKKVVTGDLVESKQLYADITSTVVKARLVICSNHILTLPDGHSIGNTRRFMLVLFPNSITPENPLYDRNLVENILREETDEVFAWMVEGLHMLAEDGYKLPLSPDNRSLIEYEEESTIYTDFFDDHIDVTAKKEDHVLLTVVAQRFKEMAVQEGERLPSNRRVTIELKKYLTQKNPQFFIDASQIPIKKFTAVSLRGISGCKLRDPESW